MGRLHGRLADRSGTIASAISDSSAYSRGLKDDDFVVLSIEPESDPDELEWEEFRDI